jgi:hypothetical protein
MERGRVGYPVAMSHVPQRTMWYLRDHASGSKQREYRSRYHLSVPIRSRTTKCRLEIVPRRAGGRGEYRLHVHTQEGHTYMTPT